jgi:hypothetical protein
MSLLSETVATVGQYNNLVTNNYHMNEQTVVGGGVTFATLTGVCTPRGNGFFQVTNVTNGLPLETSNVILLRLFMTADPPLEVDNPGVYIGVEGFPPQYINNLELAYDESDSILDAGSFYASEINGKVYDETAYSYIWENYYFPMIGISVQNGNVTAGTIHLQFQIALA